MKNRRNVVIPALLLPFLFGCAKSESPSSREVILWHWMTDREDALQKLADQYQKDTGVKVRLELYAPSDVYSSRIRASAQTGTLPDIFGVLGEPWDLASYIKSGHIADLEASMSADGGAWKSEFFPKSLANDTFMAGNQYGVAPGIYGVPIDASTIQMLY